MINKKLKGRIIELFGTQGDFAAEINSDESVVSRVVRRRKDLTPDEQMRWAKALKSDPGDLFKTLG